MTCKGGHFGLLSPLKVEEQTAPTYSNPEVMPAKLGPWGPNPYPESIPIPQLCISCGSGLCPEADSRLTSFPEQGINPFRI